MATRCGFKDTFNPRGFLSSLAQGCSRPTGMESWGLFAKLEKLDKAIYHNISYMVNLGLDGHMAINARKSEPQQKDSFVWYLKWVMCR